MKFSLKTLAAAVVMAAAATGANAAIDNGAGGNGELFVSFWDANGSYSRDLNISIDSFQSSLAATGVLNLQWSADANLDSFLTTADVASLKWNIMATDTSGARRLLTTYSLPEASSKRTNDLIRTAASNVQAFVGNVNTALAGAESVVVNNGSAAWAGKVAYGEYAGVMTNGTPLLNFSNAGTLANSSYAAGLGFMRIDAASTGIAASSYNEYMESTSAVNVWLDSSRTLHIGVAAAVPEPETYAMLLAGLGLIGFMARRRAK